MKNHGKVTEYSTEYVVQSQVFGEKLAENPIAYKINSSVLRTSILGISFHILEKTQGEKNQTAENSSIDFSKTLNYWKY